MNEVDQDRMPADETPVTSSLVAALTNPFAIVAIVVALCVGIGGTLAVQGIASAANHGAETSGVQPEKRSLFVQALSKCGLGAHSTGISVGDGGKSLALDNQGNDDIDGLSIDDELCVLKALKVPDATLDEMEATRALDGRQSDSWGQVRASWSYHPDQGLDVILQAK
ncbi:hypothetical protein GCM10009840_18090 [Pseudolysinimonas kribbensis]|uniref:Uncharacterized protein n=1 Tax=Pseudolysinimonas kribbensis TaxID=433641 RepID=A0ABQ6JZN5_9MICO|nr:hypothetical protein [Pseudolysinimonas kribbensis]GMA93808.1 hypothetical protein GCM10025881_06320 [Pseudolysinimonas kribbensis]